MATGWNQAAFDPRQQQPLPPGWEAKYDPGLGRYYFINHATKETTWKDPRYVKQEEIMMKNLQPSTSAPKSRSPQQRARIKQQKKQQQQNEETSFTFGEQLVDMPKELSYVEKEKMKRKLKQQYPGVDDGVIQVALMSAKYDESKAKLLVEEMKGDDDSQEAKRRADRRKEREREEKENKKEEEREKQRREKEMELERKRALEREREEEARRNSTASTLRSAGSTPVSVTQISVLLGDKGRSDGLLASSSPSARDFIADDTGRSSIDKFMSGSGSALSVAAMNKPGVKPGGKVQGRKANTRPKVNVVSRDKFASVLRGDYQGPNKQLHSGPNSNLLIPHWVKVIGPQRENCKGPGRTNRRGPAPRDPHKMPLNCGPQARFTCGPQSSNVAGPMYAQ